MNISDSVIWIIVAMWYPIIAMTESDGPLDIFEHLRNAPYIGGLFSCYICLTIWVSLGLYVASLYMMSIVYVFAIASMFLFVYRTIDYFSDIARVFKDEHRRDNAERLAQSMRDNTTDMPEFIQAVFKHYLSGHGIGTSVTLANIEWGNDDAE